MAGGGGVLGDEQGDRVTAERAAAAGREQGLVGAAVTFLEPCAENSQRSGW